MGGNTDQQTLAREYGVPTKGQMEAINKLARVELKPEQVFVFNAKLVGDIIIPNRYMQISKELLEIFEKDAKSGVSLLLDHSWAGWGRPKPAVAYGRTFASKLKSTYYAQDGEWWELFADHYIVRNKEIDGISTDSIIASIQDGTFFDTSIGWGAETYECSICGESIFSCPHYPGKRYVVDEGKKSERIELCYVIAKPPGFLMENSIVFDGAYPGAGVMSKDGSTDNADMVLVDDMKGLSPGVSLFHTFSARKGKLLTFARKEDMGKKLFAQGVNLSKGGVKYMDEKTLKLFETLGIEYKEGESKTEDVLKQIAEKWDATVQSIKDSATPTKDEATPYMTQDEVAGKLGKELSADELLKLAKEGDDYLAALKKDAEEWGIRAYGDKYNKDSWNIRFQYANSTELKGFIETFKVEAESAVPAGRQSDPEASAKGKPADNYPDEAFAM